MGAISLTSSSVTPHNGPGRACTGTADPPDDDRGRRPADPGHGDHDDDGDHRHRSQNTEIPAPPVYPRADQEVTATTSEALEVLVGLAESVTVMRTVEVPALVGVPLSAPVVALMVTFVGSLVADQV